MGIITGAAAAYLVGCVPVARFVRQRAAGQSWAPFAAAAADFLKGFVALMLFAPVSSIGQALVLVALVAGEQWPVAGETGKLGLWTAGGGMSALTPITPVVYAFLWGLGFVLSGYLAVGRIVGVALFWIAIGLVAGWPLGLIALPACIMVLERSREDWRRYRAGSLPKHEWNSGS